ncbi:neuralized-like protein 2 isoform X2 [Haliaeetus albicilla]|uniref:neuralized-like protein 2 isoform X2 n=1 Tax=Haliaeetus albicilla TaxID=8969 RepID=UPI0037E908F9
MAARCRLAARFHHIHGTNVRLDASRTRATRVESFANGLCFSQEPLAPGQIFLVEIEEKELGWCGHLRVGLTAHDPQSLEVVPEYSLPDLVNMGDTWVFAITRSHNRVTVDGEEARVRSPAWEPFLLIERVRIPRDTLVGRSRPGRYSHILDDLYKANVLPATARRSRIGVLYALQRDGTADMHIIINGEDMGPSARHLPTSRPLYAVVDVFASTKSVRVIPVEYGCSSLPTDPLPAGHPEAHRPPPGHRRPGPAPATEELLPTRVRCGGCCPGLPSTPTAPLVMAGRLPWQDPCP